ncbi:MAG: putative inorganic carbon transporter subunit DabA [Marinobacter sp.]
MNAPVTSQCSGNRNVVQNESIVRTIASACERIAPIWPLDRWIAVNPWWGHRQQKIGNADTELRARADTGLLMPPDFYLEAWQGGRIRKQDLVRAAREQQLPATAESLVTGLQAARDGRSGQQASLACADQLDRIRQQLGGLCARYFDSRQGRWRAATEGRDLYDLWFDQQIQSVRSGTGRLAGQLARLPVSGIRNRGNQCPGRLAGKETQSSPV